MKYSSITQQSQISISWERKMSKFHTSNSILLRLRSVLILCIFGLVSSYCFAQNIVVYGDTRTYHDVHREIVKAIRKTSPVAVFHTGDLVDNGLFKDNWDTLNSIIGELRKEAAFYPAAGNHEMRSKNYYNNFDHPGNEKWYKVDLQGIHFIVLNTCLPTSVKSEQYKWLERDLKKLDSTTSFIVAVFHHSPYSSGLHTPDEQGLRNTLVPLFEKYKVDAVITGHDHIYERSKVESVYYIVSGGGGAPLYEKGNENKYSQVFYSANHFCLLSIIEGNMVVDVLDVNMNRIDRVVIAPKFRKIDGQQ